MSASAINITVTGVNWNCGDPAECCTEEARGHTNSFAYEFCMALCQLCCCEVEISYQIQTNAVGSATKPPKLTDPNNFPEFTAISGLSFTTSQYGLVLPIVYGSDKLNGNVFWASPIRTQTVKINDQDYTYQTIDFAIGICEGEINGILKIWVGDKIAVDNTLPVDGGGVVVPGDDGFIAGYLVDLTDTDNPLQSLAAAVRQTRISVFVGSETQIPEGVMSSVEGYEGTPAYRGTAYALFENFILDGGNIPAMFFEVTSHTTTQFPRLYGDFTGTTFDTWKYFTLQYDASYDRFYAIGTKTSPAATGLIVIDGNTLEELHQWEFNNTFGIGPNYETMCVFPLSGFLAVTELSGNQGYLHVLNPHVGALCDTIGPGGSLSAHSLTTGFAAIGAGGALTFQGKGADGILADVFCGIGVFNQSIGFATIQESGRIQMQSVLNSVLPWVNNVGCVVTVTADIAEEFPTLSDGAPSQGTHIYGFSFRANERDSFKVFRVSVDGLGTVVSPTYADVGEITFDKIGGSGIDHGVRYVMVDNDGTIILGVTSQQRGTFFVKYSPYTGDVVWRTQITSLPSSAQSTGGPDWAMLTGQSYVWVDATNKVQKIDLKTGAVTTVATTLGAQSLPALSNAHQFYNSYENSLTYLTATNGQHITKAFIDRITRSTVELSDIVIDLVQRTGLTLADIDADDLSALTLNGYTVSEIKSVHDCLQELQQAFTFDVVESNGRIKYKARGGSSDFTISHEALMGADENNEWLATKQLNDGSRIRKINLTYKDIDREYMQNVQSVILTKYGSQVFDPEASIDVTVPIVLTAENAKRLAEILLYAKLVYNTTMEFTARPQYLTFDPADVVTVTMPDGEDNVQVRLRTVTIGMDNKVECQVSEENPEIYTDQVNLFGSIGRFEKSKFPTVPRRVDPYILNIGGRSVEEFEATTSHYKMFIAFLPSAPGITLKNSIQVIIDGDSTTRFSMDPPDGYPTWGYVIQPPTFTRAGMSTDYTSEIIVQLVNDTGAEMASASSKDDLLELDQVNLCYIAGELLQFQTATDLGGGRWKLTALHRGKLGTDAFLNHARVGDKFILLAGNDGVLDTLGITVQNVDVGTSPRRIAQFFMNTGNPFVPPFITVYTALNLRPWVTADAKMVYDTGDAVITWARRSRTDGEWPDDGTVPPAEEVTQPEPVEEYEMFLFDDVATFKPVLPSTYLRKVVGITSPTFTYTTAMQAADGFNSATDTLYALLYQVGSWTGNDAGAAELLQLPPA